MSIAGEIVSIIDYIRRSHRDPRHGSRADHLGPLGVTHLREVLKRLEALRVRVADDASAAALSHHNGEVHHDQQDSSRT
ncbi:hypothetical protein C2L65_25425 [Paraburkholderia terrae]|uniref:Uncharacterized protein n=2 Tax=Paraburkholderia terrae TaxID=311230 RepID=A0A2I8EVV0_9BURK|nr:hypothetical protein C2L65_25425 [Paraburkholderia terrae]